MKNKVILSEPLKTISFSVEYLGVLGKETKDIAYIQVEMSGENITVSQCFERGKFNKRFLKMVLNMLEKSEPVYLEVKEGL